jgi:hypothetical protein
MAIPARSAAWTEERFDWRLIISAEIQETILLRTFGFFATDATSTSITGDLKQ